MARYRYDGLFRRVVKESYDGGILDETRRYYYSAAWQVIAERVDGSSKGNDERKYGREKQNQDVAQPAAGGGVQYRPTNFL